MTTRTSTQNLTADLFDAFAQRDEFLGWGYIGERGRWLEEGRTEAVAAVDTAVIESATDKGWTVEDLFTWGNSKDGRWFADCALGCDDLHMAARYLVKQR